jgi:hypothetical protein
MHSVIYVRLAPVTVRADFLAVLGTLAGICDAKTHFSPAMHTPKIHLIHCFCWSFSIMSDHLDKF